MKSLILLVLALTFFLNQTTYASTWESQSPIAPKDFFYSRPATLSLVLKELLKSKCVQLSPSPILDSCLRGAEDLIKILDLDKVDFVTKGKNHYLPVVFKKDLEEVFADERTFVFLYDLDKALNKLQESFETGQEAQVSILPIAQNIYRSNPESYKVLAVLMQDSIGSKAHLRWLFQKKKSFPKNRFVKEQLNLLNEVIEKLISFSEKEPVAQKIAFYPGLKLKTYHIYHFIVSVYLAQKLKEKEHSKQISIFLPFLFNYIYEIQNDHGKLLAAIVTPESMRNSKNIYDVYCAYLGAALGAEKTGVILSEKAFYRLAKNDVSKLLRWVYTYGF